MQAPGSAWTGSVTPAEQHEWSDPGFGEFINSVFSPEYAHRLHVALKNGNVRSLQGLSGELPSGVSPDDCYATGCSWVEQTAANRLREIEHQLDEHRSMDAQPPASIRDLRNQALEVVDATLLNTLPSYFSDQRNMIGELLRRIAWSVRRDVQLDNATLPLLEKANDLQLDGMAAQNVKEALEQARVGARPESASAAAFWSAEQRIHRCPFCKEKNPADSNECPYCHRMLREEEASLSAERVTATVGVTTQPCPWCGWSIPEGTGICPNCGRPVAGPHAFASQRTEAQSSSRTERSPEIECPHCHATVPANVFFCPKCGYILKSEAPGSHDSSETVETPRSSRRPDVVEGHGRATTSCANPSSRRRNEQQRSRPQRGPLMALITVAVLIVALVIYGLIVSALDPPASTVPSVSTPVVTEPVVVAEPPVVTPAPAKQPVLPEASPRPANGATLKRAAVFSGGLGTLSIHNGTDEDSIVKLVAAGRTSVSVAVYVQSNSTTTVRDIPDGFYHVLFATGKGYYAAKKSFVSDLSCFTFDSDLDYSTSESTYSTWSITLNAVANGNARTSRVSDSVFESY